MWPPPVAERGIPVWCFTLQSSNLLGGSPGFSFFPMNAQFSWIWEVLFLTSCSVP